MAMRTGQELFNFLEWLRVSKGYNNDQSSRMADPFHIPNRDWEQLWFEYAQYQRASEKAALGLLVPPNPNFPVRCECVDSNGNVWPDCTCVGGWRPK